MNTRFFGSLIFFTLASGLFAEPELKSIFNGKNLSGWQPPKGNDEAGWYKAEDGVLKIQSGPKKKGSILWTKKEYRNFVMEFDFRFGEGVVDSGMHLRNQDQIQIGISGSLKRDMTCSPYIPGKGYPVEASNIKKLLKPKDWNTMRIQAVGKKYTVWLQGEKVMNYVSASAAEKGPVGIQLHGNRNMSIDYRNLKLAEIKTVTAVSAPLVYEGIEGPGKGKHIVFIASDHEYRGEETCPAIARILAKRYGFKCTVLFGLDEQGHIKAGSSNVPGIEALGNADMLFLFLRFLAPKDEWMKQFTSYLDRGGPVLGLRTTTHAFNKLQGKYAYYNFNSRNKEYDWGFGRQILGETWRPQEGAGHYGRNHQFSTRMFVVPEQKDHPVVRGVKDMHTLAGAYSAVPIKGSVILGKNQVLDSMKPDGKPVENKPPSPSIWVREYQSASGKKGRVFCSTQGASEDIISEGVRRCIVNGVFWCMGMEEYIKPNMNVDFVGPYQPTPFSFGGEAQNVKPSDLAGWDSPIMPKGEKHKPKKTVKRRK